MLTWARDLSLVVGAFEERRLLAMRLGELAELAAAGVSDADLELTAQWAAFICLVDDRFDRSRSDIRPEEVASLFARLLNVITGGNAGSGNGFEQALDDLWRRTAPRMSIQWRERFVADYRNFALATQEEARRTHRRCRGGAQRLRAAASQDDHGFADGGHPGVHCWRALARPAHGGGPYEGPAAGCG